MNYIKIDFLIFVKKNKMLNCEEKFNNLKLNVCGDKMNKTVMSYFNRLSVITGHRYPTDEKIRDVIGDKIFQAISVIQDTYEAPDSNIYGELRNENLVINQTLIDRVETWLNNKRLYIQSYEVINDILDKWIQKNAKKSTDEEDIKIFNEKVSKLHDMSLTEIDGNHVYHLYSDGEISTTKSGKYVYGNRSFFTEKSAILNCPKFVFPVICGNLSYAVVPQKTAYALRDEIIQMIKK